jgi:hypothetical protein
MDWTTVDALNTLLEEERASVEILVKLVSMATDGLERQALTAMGGQAVQACGDLRAHLEHLGAPISGRVSAAVDRVLGHERLDDRLRAFGQLQEQLAARIEALLLADVDPETTTLLASLRAVHLAHAAWATRRAEEFAASRQIDAEPATPMRAASLAGARAGERLEPPTLVSADQPPASEPVEQPTPPDNGDRAEGPAAPRERPRRLRWSEGARDAQNGQTS